MSDGIYTAVSGAIARQVHLDTVSHNLANVETPGYRARSVRFEELLVDRATGMSQVQVKNDDIDLSPGISEGTENPFDVAIEGDGFFTVDTGAGVGLTRAGRFRADDQGNLVTLEGYKVLNPNGQPVMVPPNSDFYVDDTGNVWDDIGIVDQLNLVSLTEGSTLTPMGPSSFKLAKGGTEASSATVRQGFIERANVNPVESMTELITLQRHFDAMQKLIQTFSTIDSRAARDLGSITG